MDVICNVCSLNLLVTFVESVDVCTNMLVP